MRTPKPYANPYVAGVALGLVLTACFVLTGQGLGASGAFAHAASATLAAVAPDQSNNAYVQSYLGHDVPWTVVEVLGILLGGAVSAVIAGRFRLEIVRGRGMTATPRLAAALVGGALMGFGAVLARGCTSGQALSGGALLSVGSWAFMLAVFVAGFAVAPMMRRLWS